MAIVMG